MGTAFAVNMLMWAFHNCRESVLGARWGVVLFLSFAALGCASVPDGRLVVDSISIHGENLVEESDIVEHLATAPSSKFLGLFRGVVYDYSVFDQRTLDRDLERIERFYRARGYYEARVRAARVFEKHGHVRVEIEVDEGSPTKIRSVSIEGVAALSAELQPAITQALASVKTGDTFDEESAARAESLITRVLTDRGYAYARVKRSTVVDVVARQAELSFSLEPGPVCVLGTVSIEGLGGVPEAPVRRALSLAPGSKYSTAEIDSARSTVLDLGVFTLVELTPTLASGPEQPPVIPLVLRVEPAKLRAIQLGGGLEFDQLRSDIHARIGWEHTNFLGGLRKLAVDLRPGVVFFPTRFPSFDRPQYLLPDGKITVAFSQPGFVEARTTGIVRAEYSIYPVLLSPKVDPAASVLGYREFRGMIGLERTLWKLFGLVSYNLQRFVPFTYVGPLDPALSGVTLSYLDLVTQVDFRNDKIEPHKGFLVANDLQIAGGPFFGDARDVRIQPEVRVFLPTTRRSTVALRGVLGFLFPMNYGSTLAANAATGQQPVGVDRASWVQDVQLTYFRAFYSGGPSSNRGYPVRGVGPHGTIPFFTPTLAAQQLAASCDPTQSAYSDARCARPLGGLSLWELSAELRFPIAGAFAGATFCDASDVSPRRLDIRPAYLHLSCGIGLRYGTPVGPVRVDLGYRIPRLQIVGKSDSAVEGDPGTVFGLPIAVALGIGEPF